MKIMAKDDNRFGFPGFFRFAGRGYVDQRVTSDRQSGGITAHTVNIQVQHRRMTPESKAEIARSLVGTSGRVMIMVLNGVGDAGELMADFNEAFERGGWQIAGSGTAFSTPPWRGFLLEPHSENGLRTAQVLKSAGIPAFIRPMNTNQRDWDLSITIGLA